MRTWQSCLPCRHDELLLYFHERRGEMGLNWSFWPRSPAVLSIRRRDEVSVTVQTNYFKVGVADKLCEKDLVGKVFFFHVFLFEVLRSSVSPCEEDESYHLPDCVARWAKRAYRDIFERHNKTGEFWLIYCI